MWAPRWGCDLAAVMGVPCPGFCSDDDDAARNPDNVVEPTVSFAGPAAAVRLSTGQQAQWSARNLLQIKYTCRDRTVTLS
jgi:hypothetical protein